MDEVTLGGAVAGGGTAGPPLGPAQAAESAAADAGDELWAELGRRGSHAALQLALRSLVLRGATFLGTIVLARLLAPSDFGVYGVISFVVALWTAFGDLGLGAALVQQPEPPSRDQLRTVWTVQQALAVAATLVIWLAAPFLAGLFPGLPSGTDAMLRVLSLGLVLSSLRTLPTVMMERDLRFGPLAVSEVLQTLVFYAVAIALAAGGSGAWSFVIAGTTQLAVGAVVVNLAWRRWPGVGVDGRSMRRLGRFGIAYQASVILVTLRDAPLAAIAGFVSGTVAAGLTQFMLRIALTIGSLDEIVARIAFPAFSRLQGLPDRQASALNWAILLTSLILVPAQCSIAALAPTLVPLVFGDKWSDAVMPLQWICLAVLLRYPARYLRQVEFARGDARMALAMTGVTTGLALACFGAGTVLGGLPGAGVGFGLGALLGILGSIWLARRSLTLRWWPFGRLLLAGLAGGVAARTVLIATTGDATTIVERWACTIGASLVFGVVFVGLVWLGNRPVLAMGARLMRRSIGAGGRSLVDKAA